MKRPSATQLAVAAAVVSWLISFYIHHPLVEGNVYSDVASFWWREENLQRGEMPCIQYFFEYPPTACLLVYASRLLGGVSLTGYYVAFSLLSLPAFIAISICLSRLAGLPGSFFILVPSMVVYGVYNFDHFFTAFLAAALLMQTMGRWRAAAVLLGLGFSVKLFTVLLLPLLMLETGDKRKAAETGLLFAAGALPTWVPILLINPGWLFEFVSFHASWGLENSWLVWLSNDPFSQSTKIIAYLAALVLIIRAYTYSASFAAKSFLTLSGFLIGSPTFTPQMTLWLIPFTASFTRLWVWLPLFESANVAILFTWFLTDTPTLPWTPPQTMALLRAIALSAMWATVYRAPTSANFRYVSSS
ncbi:conserved hypothetical protein [Candidatus Caldarchaeum subterraneum]|uniref:DUF2029 domain-containing protein n=1 Tax=Caldiarchaeum subterraneum TaxID=311458 RepID=E6N7E1_CALS0|nr:conserved hypothetical protein [Candidatus Caldarchaeum subterraneum]BAJ51005.1 conserved hypothetical protein [Candidatus Caldarchaeum subterraneum]